MTHSKHRKTTLSALVTASILAMALPALGANASNDSEAPLVTLPIPADPHMPVILRLQAGGHSYRMIVDTGASDIAVHLPVAMRDMTPVPVAADAPSRGNGLHGEVELHYFKANGLTAGDWTLQGDGSVLALDLGAVVQAYGADGLLGVSYLSQLNWHWDNRSHRLSGYRPGSPALAAARAHLKCEALLDVDGMPAVAVRVGTESAPFVLDTGDMGESGNLNTQDRDALQARGAILDSATVDRHVDLAGNALPALRISQVQNVMLGNTRLDGLTFGEISNNSRFGRAFLDKFDEVVLDFEGGAFCHTDMAQVDPDDMSYWHSAQP